jgi:hypothetical protein
MKFYLILVQFFVFYELSFSQKSILGDSLKIEFILSNKAITIVSKESDLTYKIIFTNISQRTIYSYSKLIFDKAPSVFANYDCQIFKKNKSKYVQANHYAISSNSGYFFDSLSAIYGPIVDSSLCTFDISKKKMFPLESDTLSYNILINNIKLLKGEYKFKILLRTLTRCETKNGKLKFKKIEYLQSNWYHFTLLNNLKSSQLIQP